MNKIITILVFTLSWSHSFAMEDALLDIINGIWAADQFNQLCTEKPIALPATEAELTQALLDATGTDFVGEIAATPFYAEMNLRDHAKALVDSHLKDGCDTKAANEKRESIISNLSRYREVFVAN
ncbi:MAG: hypothetical protein JKY50_10805 [Oleispira sp.]|nr:hypothetical protein [Oleispira sp.]MBL4880876.1 hypothetical protein [Oleispira sp.]